MKSEIIISGNRFSTSLNYEVTNCVPIKFEVYSFIGIVANYFNLQPVLIERIKFVFNEIWNKHATFFNTIRYENTVLGVMIFVVDEFFQSMCIDDIPVDVSDFVEMLYGKNNIDKNIIQVYAVYQNVSEIFNKPCLAGFA